MSLFEFHSRDSVLLYLYENKHVDRAVFGTFYSRGYVQLWNPMEQEEDNKDNGHF